MFYALLAVINILFMFTYSQAESFSFVNKYPQCRNEDGSPLKTSLNPEIMSCMKRKGRFPLSYFSLDRSINLIDNLDAWHKHKLKCANDVVKCDLGHDPERIELLLGSFSKIVRDLYHQDIIDQRNLLDAGLVCSQIYREFNDKSNYPKTGANQEVKITEKNFIPFAQNKIRDADFIKKLIDNRTPPSPQDCYNYASQFVPEMKTRFFEARALFKLAQTPRARSKDDLSDYPIVSEIFESYLPLAKKYSSGKGLAAPLSESEQKKFLELAAKYRTDEAQEFFQVMISASPILLLVNDRVDAENLSNAFQILANQSRLDVKQLSTDSVEQEIMLQSSYVFAALNLVPDEDRADTCYILDEIIKNVVAGRTTIPKRLMALLFLSLGSLGVTAQSATQFIAWTGYSKTALDFSNVGIHYLNGNIELARAKARCMNAIAVGGEINIEALNDENRALENFCNIASSEKVVISARDEAKKHAYNGVLNAGITKAMNKLLKFMKSK